VTGVLFYVQHLLGIGHLRRAALIAKAMDRAGLRVVLVSGGQPVPGLDIGGAALVQLPPVRARDDTFSVLADGEGQPVDEAWKAARAARLLEIYAQTRPKVLLVEMFPFGRRQMRFELLPLLDAARASAPRPQILCSLRDVLGAARSAEKVEWMLATFRHYFDQLLVHGDPAFLPLQASFPRAGEIAARTRYTGYVVEAVPRGEAEARMSGEVIVSAGGGAVAGPLIAAALAARPPSPLATATWRILVGSNLPEDAFQAARREAPNGVVVERARPDFTALLSRARLSISQGGYNTILEVLAAGVPAVIVPFAGSGETEQDLRASALGERGAITVLPEARLSPAALAVAIQRALEAARPTPNLRLDLGGMEKTARLVGQAAAIVSP
jgi:predicted glycosyltransferase